MVVRIYLYIILPPLRKKGRHGRQCHKARQDAGSGVYRKGVQNGRLSEETRKWVQKVGEFDEMRDMLDADEERIDDLERQNEALQERIEELEFENHKLGATIDSDNKIILALTRALHKERTEGNGNQ